MYRKFGHLEVIGYSYSMFVECVDTRKSTFDYVVLLVRRAILCIHHRSWIYNMLWDYTIQDNLLWNFILGLGIVNIITVYCDNST